MVPQDWKGFLASRREISWDEREETGEQGGRVRILRLWRNVRMDAPFESVALLSKTAQCRPARVSMSREGSIRLSLDLLYGSEEPGSSEIERAVGVLGRRMSGESELEEKMPEGELSALQRALREIQIPDARQASQDTLQVPLPPVTVYMTLHESMSLLYFTVTGFPRIPEEQREKAAPNIASMNFRLKWSAFAMEKDGTLPLHAVLFIDPKNPDRELLKKALDFFRNLTKLFTERPS